MYHSLYFDIFKNSQNICIENAIKDINYYTQLFLNELFPDNSSF